MSNIESFLGYTPDRVEDDAVVEAAWLAVRNYQQQIDELTNQQTAAKKACGERLAWLKGLPRKVSWEAQLAANAPGISVRWSDTLIALANADDFVGAEKKQRADAASRVAKHRAGRRYVTPKPSPFIDNDPVAPAAISDPIQIRISEPTPPADDAGAHRAITAAIEALKVAAYDDLLTLYAAVGDELMERERETPAASQEPVEPPRAPEPEAVETASQAKPWRRRRVDSPVTMEEVEDNRAAQAAAKLLEPPTPDPEPEPVATEWEWSGWQRHAQAKPEKKPGRGGARAGAGRKPKPKPEFSAPAVA